MTNDLGRRVKTAGPSTPVSITGLNETPMAGDHFAVYEDEKSARAEVKNVLNVLFLNSVKQRNELVLKTSLIPLKQVRLSQLM